MCLKYEGHKEIFDTRPVELPLGYSKPDTLEQLIAKCIRNNDLQKLNNELETEQEADDFECDDDEPFNSPYEMKEMQDEPIYGTSHGTSQGTSHGTSQGTSHAGRQEKSRNDQKEPKEKAPDESEAVPQEKAQ